MGLWWYRVGIRAGFLLLSDLLRVYGRLLCVFIILKNYLIHAVSQVQKALWLCSTHKPR